MQHGQGAHGQRHLRKPATQSFRTGRYRPLFARASAREGMRVARAVRGVLKALHVRCCVPLVVAPLASQAVLAAVRGNGLELRLASAALRRDREVVLEAVRRLRTRTRSLSNACTCALTHITGPCENREGGRGQQWHIAALLPTFALRGSVCRQCAATQPDGY